ncbi:hypothetical protein PT974_04416 [Cladobotryum mycophilum]|uniref:LCCL domain-containing protein n=1 Tax=Cladobotryum mycophilum TaxID=491253 RepID=A0ABR0SV28_9HYPO
MSVPTSKNLGNFAGIWAFNAQKSDLHKLGDYFKLKGAKSTGDQKKDIDHIGIEITSPDFASTTKWDHCLDYEWRNYEDAIDGVGQMRTGYISLGEIEETYLKGEWLEGEGEVARPDGKNLVMNEIKSKNHGWVETQIWGFEKVDGERKHTKRVRLVTAQGEVIEMRAVYDFVEE